MLLSLAIFGPIASALVYFYFGRIIGRKADYLMLILYGISVISCFILLYSTITNNLVIILSFTKLSTILALNLEFAATNLSMVVLTVIILVSNCVNCYAIYYMSADAFNLKFIGLLSAFTFSMSLLAISSNLISLFIFWELIGLFSFLLIGFWNDRTLATISSLKALFMNKIGDVSLTVAIIFLIVQLSSTELSIINTLHQFSKLSYYDMVNIEASTYISQFLFICFIIAAAAKSAQILLHTWLSDAMQGPTPVSSLLHAATLVVAGVVLLVKVAELVCVVSMTQLQIIGIISALLGGILALSQTDIKSIIAYSTLSQFGYIISISSLATISLAYFHVATHACFKAALFMCAGALIHSNYDNQDIRKFGAIVMQMPISYAAMLACSASLITMPYLSGNISKDLIIEAHFSQFRNVANFAFVLGLLASTLTVIYSIKLLIAAFLSTSNANTTHFSQSHEANLYALVPITILSLLAIVLGYLSIGFVVESNLINDLFIKIELWLAAYNYTINMYFFTLPLTVKILPLLALLISLPIAILFYTNGMPLIVSKITLLDRALFARLYFDSITAKLHFSTIKLSYWLANSIDLGLLELIINVNNFNTNATNTNNNSNATNTSSNTNTNY